MNLKEIDLKKLKTVSLSAQIVALEEKNPSDIEEINRLKTELKILDHQIEPSKEINHEIH